MAFLINNKTGNMSAAGTWSAADTTSFQDSEAASSASTTSWVASQSFAPGAITIDALALKVLSHTLLGNVAVKLGKNGTVTAISIANPTHVVSANHGLVTGEAVLLAGTNSTPALTGPYTVTVLDANTFTVPVSVTVAGTAGTWQTPLANIASNTLVAVPVFTTTAAHGFTAGSTQITIKGSTATPSFNGTYTVATTPTATTFTLTGAPSAVGGVTGLGFYNISGVADTLVVVAAADLSTVNATSNNGFAQFILPSSVTLNAGTNYTLQISGTTAGNITPYRSATAGDWARILRTTTNQAPASGDTMYIAGDHTSPGVLNSYTVTMDNTNTTSWGGLQIADLGTFAYGTAASTAYYFRIANAPTVYSGATFNIGTAGTPMPSTSTAQLEIVCASNVQFGLEVRSGGMMNTGGNVITNSALLAADASVSATSLTTNVATGWKNGNVIALAATTQTRLQSEAKALTADASGTTLTITGLTNAHGGGGTAGVVAELINLTRNVQIFSLSTTLQTYVHCALASVVDFESTEFFNMGSATASKRGIDLDTTTGSATINNCSIHDFNVASSTGINCNAAANANISISNTNLYNIVGSGVITTGGTATSVSINNVIVILSGASCFSLSNLYGTITNITAVSGLTQGMVVAQAQTSGVMGTINNLTAHSNTGVGLNFAGITNFGNNPYGYISNLTSWRNSTYGMVIGNTFDTIFDTGTMFGNATACVQYSSSTGNTFLRNLVLNAGTTLVTPVGIAVGNDTKESYIDNCTMGVTTQFATGDVQISAANIYPRLFFRNCIMNSATQVATPGNMIEGGQISSARHQQTAGNHMTWKKFGTTKPDTIIWNKASPSERLTPSNAANKIQSGYKKIAVPNGQTAVINVFVRKSVAGDGTAYNGNQVRLIQRADAATGNNTDVVLASSTNAANGAFQLLTATIAAVTDDCAVTFYIDADGTAGWVNVDDWSVNS